ncbi:glucan phosphoethanolaminetransferase (alkaline phosphatase superfamily) [Anaerosolibacter carboniphilus]|uniref:Glucan phosphoethanolaminetransferase (Alkaline phosphatase superfamily) n=1 Tax=Anaerosolibacter carboniphilus TaxID=1417629 RepID=A0A841KYZ8_9FIRM|nr:glucan phosphoethanolaminetransferase (alkaline phosphatase superfamily) [Anaerosolibacter carboniphilus]
MKIQILIFLFATLSIFISSRIIYSVQKNNYSFKPFEVIKTGSLDFWLLLTYFLALFFFIMNKETSMIAIGIFIFTFIPSIAFIYYKHFIRTRHIRYLLSVIFMAIAMISIFIYNYFY